MVFVHVLDWTDSLWQTQGLGKLGGYSSTCNPTDSQFITKLVSWRLFGRMGNWYMVQNRINFKNKDTWESKSSEHILAFDDTHSNWGHWQKLANTPMSCERMRTTVNRSMFLRLTKRGREGSRLSQPTVTAYKSIFLCFCKSPAAVHHWTVSRN